MDQKLQGFIKNVSARIPDEDLPLLERCAQTRHLKKGEILLNVGEICREFYLVNEGYLRTWYNKDGFAINLNFTFEGNFITNPQSIHGREPSELVIEAGENTSLWVFNMDEILNKFDRDPQIVLFIRRLALHILLAVEEHSNFFKTHTPTERYRYIEKNNPMLLQRIPLSQIASYLGVTRETISRIRAKKD
jgi:CRP-like cAMP-binding protein